MESVIVTREQLAKVIFFSYVGDDIKTYKTKLAAWRQVMSTKFVAEAVTYAKELYQIQNGYPPSNM